MFGVASLSHRLPRAIACVRAFVLLEDPAGASLDLNRCEPAHVPREVHWHDHEVDCAAAAHPHRQPLRRPLRPRRPGSVPEQRAVCITPIVDQSASSVASQAAWNKTA
ncbi:MAG: hypothetical protein ACR2LK_14545 [Solirubrobacteraceae bacterium]